jgi:hypothetical protein
MDAPRSVFRGNEPLTLIRRDDCAQLFLLYGGRTQVVLIHPLEFMKQTGLLNRNVVMIRDLNNICYQRGVSPTIADIPAFLQWQNAIVASLPHVREVYCVGSSAGAYAALLSGHFLKAKGVWAFAPPVPVMPNEHVTYIDQRFADAAAILARDNGATTYHVYYNEAQALDRRAAERLKPLPGVRLYPQSGEGHLVLGHMLQNRSAVGLLPDFVAASRPANSSGSASCKGS